MQSRWWVSRLAGVGLLAWAPRAAAVEPSPAASNLTLEAVVALAVKENAELKSQRARVEAMRERPAQAGALNDPMLTYGGMDAAGGGSWPDTGEKRLMLQQQFPWPGKRQLRAEIAAKEAETARRDLEGLTREVILRARESYYELYSVQRVRRIAEAEREVLRRIAQVAEAMYGAGERSQVDVLKAQSELTLLEQKLLELQAQEITQNARLNTLLNRRADGVLGDAVTPPAEPAGEADLAALFQRAAANRPEIRAAQTQAERYELERRLMAKESAPDYALGVEYRSFAEEDDMVMATVSLNLPVWRSRIRSGVREAEHMRASSLAAREAAEQQSGQEVQEAYARLQTARRTHALYVKELVPQAQARFSASEAGYRAGQVDFLDLLESERFLLDARTMAAAAEGAIGVQAARLDRAVGGSVLEVGGRDHE